MLFLFILIFGFVLVHFFVPEVLSVAGMRRLVEAKGVYAPLIFMAVYSLAVVSFLPASPFSLLAGVLFGPWWGTLYIVVAATVGATAAFFIARFFGGDFIQGLLVRYGEKIAAYNAKLIKKGFATVLFLRLIPLFPFNVLNFILGLTKVRPRSYILATALGIIPGAFVFAYAGATAATPSFGKILFAGGILALLFFIKPIVTFIFSAYESKK